MLFCERDCKRDKEIVRLREVEKWIYKDIAKKFDISNARARQLYLRIVKERKKEKL